MNDRFKFNAIVSSYYDIDTPEEYKEVEPQFYLKNVDVFCTQEIGIDYDALFEAVKEQSKNLTEKEIGQIMQHFEDNSNSPDCDFVTITPDKIIQCTGLKDKNGKFIYEGDIAKYVSKNRSKDFNVEIKYLDNIDLIESDWLATGYFCVDPNSNLSRCDILTSETALDYEVIGNIYENKELLEEGKMLAEEILKPLTKEQRNLSYEDNAIKQKAFKNYELSKREIEVLNLVAKGHTNKKNCRKFNHS